jgi:hypothetical protein
MPTPVTIIYVVSIDKDILQIYSERESAEKYRDKIIRKVPKMKPYVKIFEWPLIK